MSKWSIAHRVELVQAILRTITLETTEEITLTPTQVAVIEKRAVEIAAGLVQTVCWEQVENKLVERYGLQN
ncbi:MAG: addiction module protein [Saprospiraceae bacterium]|nr:addiction module protein [Saprospiraceae bacterium]